MGRPAESQISIHALREEGDRWKRRRRKRRTGFQSTPSARRATSSNWSYGTSHSISIHALREEGDNRTRNQSNRQNRFQSTPSARRATANLGEQAVLKKISIHALREEGDQTPAIKEQSQTYFNPRPPRGGRLRSTGARWQSIPYFNPRPPRGGRPTKHWRAVAVDTVFQSTPSARRATTLDFWHYADNYISIHALREEGDWFVAQFFSEQFQFQSTPSARRATKEATHKEVHIHHISIHALREEGDPPPVSRKCSLSTFQSTPSARRATSPPPWRCLRSWYFNPRPPRGGRPCKDGA